MLHFRTLGSLSLTDDAGALVGAAAQQSRLVLLAVLAVSGASGMARDRLLALHWPESDTERARGSLKQALYALRRDTGQPALVTGTRSLHLNADVVQTDVDAFSRAVADDRLEAAVAHYGGPFLEGVFFREELELERFVDGERDRLSRAYRGALRELARRADATGRYDESVTWWQRLLVEEPVSAASILGLMRALSRAGDVAGVQSAYRRHERAMRDQLDEAPDPQVVQAAHELTVSAANAFATSATIQEQPSKAASPPPLGRADDRTIVGAPLAGPIPPSRSRRVSAPMRALGGMTIAVAGAALFLGSRPPLRAEEHRVQLVIDDALPAGARTLARNMSESVARRLAESTIATPITASDNGMLAVVTERWSRRSPAELQVSIGTSSLDGVTWLDARVTRVTQANG